MRWCALLDRILAGRAAESVDRASVRAQHALVVLPSFALVDPELDMGRKSLASDGATLRFPARVVWDGEGGPSPVFLLPAGERVERSWELVGVGVHESGSTKVSARHHDGHYRDDVVAHGVPVELHAAPMGKREILGALDRLGADGSAAMWEARQILEAHAGWMLQNRHSAVSGEIFDGLRSRPLLDAIDLEVVRNELLLGDPERRISPAYDRIIERCLLADAFSRVDPERRVMASLRSVAETAIRRRIGDPHLGRKVRRLLAAEQFDGVDGLIARYRELWPRDSVGVRRIEAAVSVRQSVLPTPFDRLDAVADDRSATDDGAVR